MPLNFIARKAREAFSREPWFAELWSALAATGWAIWSSLSQADLIHRPAYRLLGELGPAEFWELSGAMLGVLQFCCLVAADRPSRWIAAFLLSAWWSFLTLAFLQGDPSAPNVWLFMCYAGANFYSLFKLVRPYD